MRQDTIIRTTRGFIWLITLSPCLHSEQSSPKEESQYPKPVPQFAHNILKSGPDTYRPKHMPLFLHGLNIHTHDPLKRIDPYETKSTLSNFATHQTLLRRLHGLSTIIFADSLGNIPRRPHTRELKTHTIWPDVYDQRGFLELYDKTVNRSLLQMARPTGDNIRDNQLYKKSFLRTRKMHVQRTVDCFERFVLLHLVAPIHFQSCSVPKIRPSCPPFLPPYRYKQMGAYFCLIYPLTESPEPALSLEQEPPIRYVNMLRSLLHKGLGLHSSNSHGSMKRTALQRAAICGRKDLVELLLAKGARIDAKDAWPAATALDYAAEMGDKDVARLLISRGADVNTRRRCPAGDTPLHSAVRRGHKGIAALLIDSGADVNAKNDAGQTPIQIALKRNRTDIVELLRLKGAVIDMASIHIAAKVGDLTAVKAFLEGGAEINTRDDRGLAPLHHAAQAGHKDVAAFLITRGADINSKDKYGYTPLYYAIWSENTEIVRLLVGKGADVNLRPEKDYSLLHYAVWNGDSQTVRLLVDKGARFDVKDRDGWTAFRYAASQGSQELVQLFICRGADTSSFHAAACLGELDRAKAFIENGSDLDAKDAMDWTPLYWAVSMAQQDVAEYLIKTGADVRAKAKNNSTALHQAARSGSTKLVRLLLAKGAHVNAKDNHGNTPLQASVSAGHPHVLEILIAKGADVNAKSANGSTPLHNAARQGRKALVELLLAKGAVINAEDNRGLTPLWWASRRGHKEIVHLLIGKGATTSLHTVASTRDLPWLRRLIAKGADVNSKDKHGRTPLHRAAAQGFHELLEELIFSNADVDVKDNYGQTPLHRAAVKGHKNIIEILLDNRAHVDAKDNAGRTPLHYAVGAHSQWRNGPDHVDIAALLLDKGANINAMDNQGWTPLHYAAAKCPKATVVFLINRGADSNAVNERGHTALSLVRSMPSRFSGHPSQNAIFLRSREIEGLLGTQEKVYYISPNGNDSNPGTFALPFGSISAAIHIAGPGDVILVRGGLYSCSSTIRIDKSGEKGKPIRLRAYSDEAPAFDFSRATGDGFLIMGGYWHINGLIITKAEQWGIRLETAGSHNNILEQIAAYSNGLAGIALLNGACRNLVLNCDSHGNFDRETNGENADGFTAARILGKGNIFIGCRAWNNSDDGFDLGLDCPRVRLENCYVWRNGENIWGHPCFRGNANGFKLGSGAHVLIRCVAWDHPVRGFKLQGEANGVTLYNCTAFRNRSNYQFIWPTSNIEKNVLRDCLSSKGGNQIKPEVDDQFNSWNTPPGIEITEEDFLSLDDATITGPRDPEGGIPESGFLTLAPDSDAIDAGMDVGLPFAGKRPDLGAFEYRPTEVKQNSIKWQHQAVRDHDIERIHRMLANGADVNEKDWLGYAPLHWAVYFGYLDVAELLLGNGANPNLESESGRTPLEIATEMAYEEIVELLRKPR